MAKECGKSPRKLFRIKSILFSFLLLLLLFLVYNIWGLAFFAGIVCNFLFSNIILVNSCFQILKYK